jgi:quercetin dioxygenase-like cupin family protein
MSTIRVCRPGEAPLQLTRDIAGEDVRAKLSVGELETAARYYHPGGPNELQMFELSVPADTVIGQHAHEEDEIMYVVDGELHLGRQVLAPGASLHIPGNTLYSFKSGPAGLRVLNFRAHADATYITKDEFIARRTATAAE